MPAAGFDFDLFFFWRRLLMIACTIYAIVRLVQSVWTWIVYLAQKGRYIGLARQYLLIQLLRLSPWRFAWQLLDLAVLVIVFLIVVGLHSPMGK